MSLSKRIYEIIRGIDVIENLKYIENNRPQELQNIIITMFDRLSPKLEQLQLLTLSDELREEVYARLLKLNSYASWDLSGKLDFVIYLSNYKHVDLVTCHFLRSLISGIYFNNAHKSTNVKKMCRYMNKIMGHQNIHEIIRYNIVPLFTYCRHQKKCTRLHKIVWQNYYKHHYLILLVNLFNIDIAWHVLNILAF